MRYIEDKRLFAAVMYALKIARPGAYARAENGVRKASSHYKIDESLIYPYIAEAMRDDARGSNEFALFYNCKNATGLYGYWAIVCPKCGKISVVGDYNHEINEVRRNPCGACGFVDRMWHTKKGKEAPHD